ncbi:MAG: hypothetical protein ACTSO7_06555 [Candidatus Heimdallarchaeota archaeon]
MTNKELQKYDKQVRKEIYLRVQRPVDEETVLMSFIVSHQKHIPTLCDFPYLLEFEYEIIPGKSNLGRGDLLFSDGENNFLIVETKYLKKKTTGKTKNKNTTRRKQRRKAEKQVIEYSHDLKNKYPQAKTNSLIIYDETLEPPIHKLFLKYQQELQQKWLEREKIVYPTKNKI